MVSAQITGGDPVSLVVTRRSRPEGSLCCAADSCPFQWQHQPGRYRSVMREIMSRVPSGVRRIPDGETGERGNWIFFQIQQFRQSPWLVPARPLDTEAGNYEQLPRQQLADGVDPADMSWPDIGYADV